MEGQYSSADNQEQLNEKLGTLPSLEEYENLQNLFGNAYVEALKSKGPLTFAACQLADGILPASEISFGLDDFGIEWGEKMDVMKKAIQWAKDNGFEAVIDEAFSSELKYEEDPETEELSTTGLETGDHTPPTPPYRVGAVDTTPSTPAANVDAVSTETEPVGLVKKSVRSRIASWFRRSN